MTKPVRNMLMNPMMFCLVLMSAAILGGCFNFDCSVVLKYSVVNPTKAATRQEVILAEVTDVRKSPEIVGRMQVGNPAGWAGKVLSTKIEPKAWVQKALSAELEAAGLTVASSGAATGSQDVVISATVEKLFVDAVLHYWCDITVNIQMQQGDKALLNKRFTGYKEKQRAYSGRTRGYEEVLTLCLQDLMAKAMPEIVAALPQ